MASDALRPFRAARRSPFAAFLVLAAGFALSFADAGAAAQELAQPAEPTTVEGVVPGSGASMEGEPVPAAPAPPAPPALVVPRDWLVIAPLDRRGRRPFSPDAVFARYLLAPDALPPVAGEELTGELGTAAAWTAVQADENGRVNVGEDPGLGWACCVLPSDDEVVMLAELSGAGRLFVNGVAQAGDLYGMRFGGLPVVLHEGPNTIFVGSVRGGGFTLRFARPETPLLVALGESTRPELVAGERPPEGSALGLLVLNATRHPIARLALSTGGGDGPFEEVSPEALEPLGPLGVLKVPLPIVWKRDAPPPEAGGQVRLPLRVAGLPDVPPLELSLDLVVRDPHEARRCTYVSSVDRSVQEYSVLPPSAPEDGAAPRPAPGIVLSLHGAGVGSRGQAASYSPKPDLWIVAPNNRRPFGFDWQDWGRRDAYDVLAIVGGEVGADPLRTYLTGHSMGGHGTWHLAANDPDRWAAIAPSAGWASFDSYTGRPDGALAALWHGADLAGETERFVDALAQLPIYAIHGTADDNVPVSEERTLVELVRAAGGTVEVHEQEGAGHWWDGDASPGADCVDWPPAFELFGRSRRAVDPDSIHVTIASPATNARHDWMVALQELRPGEVLTLAGTRDRDARTVTITTGNVRRFAFEWPREGGIEQVIVDGQAFPRGTWEATGRHAGLVRATAPEFATDAEAGPWAAFEVRPGSWPIEGEKSPERSGPFKRAFDDGFVLVHGTAGDDAEDATLYARARADATTWWYRGNGHALLLPDSAWRALRNLPEFAGRSVILYGNRDTNAAFAELVPEGDPFDARRGSLRLGARSFEGDDLLGLVVRPMPGDARALVGLVADSGIRGARLGDTLALFVSGVGYPDYALVSSRILAEGDGGVLAAGWFGHDWSLPASH